MRSRTATAARLLLIALLLAALWLTGPADVACWLHATAAALVTLLVSELVGARKGKPEEKS